VARPPAPNRSPLESLLDAILGESSLEGALDAGLAKIAAHAMAEAGGVFLVDEGRPVLERWHPHDWSPPKLLAEQLRVAARAHLTEGADERAKRPPLGWRVLPLPGDGRTLGALVLGPPRRALRRGRELERMARALAIRAAADLEVTRVRSLQTRYERWFKTLDEQLRVLDRERQKFASFVHASGASVFVTDPSRVIRWTNAVMSERPPVDGTTWSGRTCREVCSGIAGHGHQECEECPVGQALARGQVVHREFRRSNHGEPRSHYLTAMPIKGPDGRPAEAMVMIQDLSDLEMLRTSELRYRQVFERSDRGIVMVDPATRELLLANARAASITGHDPEALTRLRLEDLHAPAEWQRLSPHYQAALAGGDLGMLECRVLTRSGEERVAIVSSARTDFDGREVLMLDFVDITETRRVEVALHQAEERLRWVIGSSPLVLFALDRDGIFTLSEGRALEELGLQPGEAVGSSVFDLYRDHPSLLSQVRRALDGEEFTVVLEVGEVAFETSFATMRDPEGTIQEVIGVATDVTERHKLETQLRHAQRMEAIGRLAGGVAHDFNNLLAAILGHSELMMSRLEPGHPIRRSAEEVQRAAVRGAMLTRQLLAFGRRDMLTLQVLDMNAVVDEMDGMLRRLIGEDIELESHGHDLAVPVRADRGQLEQVIVNLVVNARDAMPQGGKLTIAVTKVTFDEAYAHRHGHARPGPHAMLTITDTGIGMDEETLAHAFEPFYTTKPRDKGTGLGLATVYGIVERCGGHILVYSEPGLGTSFKVCLPLAEGLDVAPSPPPETAPADGGTETILLAEDEDAVRALAREVLEGKGYRVLEARSGHEALALAAGAGWIDLLVTDVVMPQMGGGELAQRLAALRPGIKVLFVSGYPDDAIVRHGVLERGSAMLQKPFELEAFARKVREVIDSVSAGQAA
jgi:PAS domain S-box-containing protein